MEQRQKRSYQKWSAEDEAKLYAVARQTGCNWYLVRVQWFPEFTELQIRHKYYQLRQRRQEQRAQARIQDSDVKVIMDRLMTLLK